MTFSRTDVDPRYWDKQRFVRQLVFIAQDGGAGANFLQHLLGKHEGFFQQFDRHIVENNEYISSMPLHDAESAQMGSKTRSLAQLRDARQRISKEAASMACEL